MPGAAGRLAPVSALALLAAACGDAVVVGTSAAADGAQVARAVEPRELPLERAADGSARAWLSLRGRAFRIDVDAHDAARAPTIDVVRGEGGAPIAKLAGAWTRDSANPLARIDGVAALRLPAGDGTERAYAVALAFEGRASGGGARLTADAATTEFGEVALGGRTFRYALRDANADGSYADLDHLEFTFDRDGDGVFDGDPAEGAGETVDLSRPFDLGTGTFFVRAVSDDGTRVEFERSRTAVAPTPFLGRGDVAPPIDGPALDGSPVALGAARGKRTLIVFWASWCGECRSELEIVARDWDEVRRNFDGDVVGVSLDDDAATARAFATDLHLPFPSIHSLGAAGGDAAHSGWSAPLAVAYGVRALPAAVVVGADGRVERRRASALEFVAPK